MLYTLLTQNFYQMCGRVFYDMTLSIVKQHHMINVIHYFAKTIQNDKNVTRHISDYISYKPQCQSFTQKP